MKRAACERTQRSAERQPPANVPTNGAALLDQVYAFLGRFVAYPSEHARVAHTLWIAHAHAMDAFAEHAAPGAPVARARFREKRVRSK